MFLVSVAEPRKVCNGLWFDVKAGIWLIMDIVLVKRDSKNRKKGTPILKPAPVNGERYKKLMIKDVIPTIKARMPRPPGHTIFVQEDGAKQGTGKGVMKAIQDVAGDDITLESQPANSPDLNINDFGFFQSVQQLMEDVGVTNVKAI
ncbi:unnamed protein product, partial [Discosporangium mesarthrocarpum]